MRIVLATDGSASSEQARALVAAVPWPAGSTIRIVSVVPYGANIAMDWSPDQAHIQEIDRYRDPLVRSRVVALADAERDLSLAHPDALIERFLLRGRAASLIVREAHDLAADLVVVGHRGHGTIETMLLGSVSAEVVDHAPCAVLVARSAELGPVVFADDGSPSARVAATVLERMPLPQGTPITVLTVIDSGFAYETAVAPALYNEPMLQYKESADQSAREAHAVTATAAARFQQVGYRANEVVDAGDPAMRIVEYVQEHRTGLLVLGTRGNTGLRRLLLGSVARNVLLHAPCSVLVVRESVSPPADGQALIAEIANRSSH
jgi:nucleotide-binding universal stress UspA family protein